MTDIEYREGDQPLTSETLGMPLGSPPWEQPEAVEPEAVEPEPDPVVEVDAWGLSRDEWVNHPTLRDAHGEPRTDERGMAWYDCRECEAVYPSLSGLLMHRNRQHVSAEMKAERHAKMSQSQTLAAQRKREKAANPPSAYAGEDPGVQAILAATLVKGSAEYEARRKRWYNAQKRGMSEAQFNTRELQRAIAIAEDPESRTILSMDPDAYDDQPKAKKKGSRPKKMDEQAQADDLFERVGKATDILFPNGVHGAHILPVAELQKDMLALMQGLAQ